ncbi:MAG: hypothetical protein K5764_05485 [Prevotella sp.]|nr:hypothetical protein [Prevotella sp.]
MKIKSLTLRISIVVTIMTLLVLLATLLTVYTSAINYQKKEAAQETSYKLDLVIDRLSRVQTSVEQAANYSVMALKSHMADTMAVMEILNNIVATNQYVNCAALAYAPNRLPGHPYCIPIAVNYGVVSHYFSDKDLNGEYIYDDWYIAPSLEGIPFWTDPYYNMLDVPVVSYAVPVASKEHGFEGVLTLAVELTNLNALLTFGPEEKADSTRQSKSVNIILDRNTTFLTTRNKDFIMNETLFTLAESKNDTLYNHIGREILAKRDGEEVVMVEGEKSVITWRVLPDLNWTAMVITPYSEVFASVNALTYLTIFVALLATIAAILILYFSVRRALRPFKRLKSATHLLGEGKYDVQLPYRLTERADEIGDLGREFMRMEKAVKKKIDELEEEHERLRHSYEMLSTLMHNVVSHLRLPVNDMLNYNDALATLANNSEDAELIKKDAQKAASSILQQFNQLNELSNLISTKTEDEETMIVVSSEDFVEDAMKGAHQLEERFFLTVNEASHDKRKINIRSNTHVLESLLYELIIETAKVSRTSVVNLHFMFNIDMSALRIMIEMPTDKPIPEEEKPNFFKRFAEQKVNAYATSGLLPLYICYMIAKRLGVRIYVEPNSSKKPVNIFVLEVPKAD